MKIYFGESLLDFYTTNIYNESFETSHGDWYNVYDTTDQWVVYNGGGGYGHNSLTAITASSTISGTAAYNALVSNNATDVIIFRSPKFSLTPSFTIKVSFYGGIRKGSTTMWDVPESGLRTSSGYRCLALRRISDNKYIADFGRDEEGFWYKEPTINVNHI